MNNSFSDSPTRFGVVHKTFLRVVRSCFGWLPCLRRNHRVHPENTDSGNNIFIKLGSQRRIRIIHIDSKTTISNSLAQCSTKSVDRNVEPNELQPKSRCRSTSSLGSASSVDEYWFTRWSQPLRITDNCNCSFRRNWRKSVRATKQSQLVPGIKPQVHFNNKNKTLHISAGSPEKIKIDFPTEVSNSSHIESFAADFIQDILLEAISYLSANVNSNLDLVNNYNSHDIDVVHTIKTNSLSNLNTGNSETKHSMTKSFSSERNEWKDSFVESPANDSDINTVQLSYNDNTLNENTGCVNPSFLDSPSDPSGNLRSQTPSRKECKHVKKPTKPLLYFLHSVGSSADIWQNLLNYFVSVGYEVVAPDMLGHGFSASPDNAAAYTFQRLLQDAVDIFDRFVGEHGKCVVIGHAYGCSLAAAVARHRPQVTHLVLISGGGPTPLAPAHKPAIFPCAERLLKPFVVCGFKRDSLYAPCGKHMSPCEALSDGVPKYVLRHVAQGQDWPEGDSTFHRRILVPTLLVHGMCDPHVTLVQECEMERTIPRSFLELIPNAGHLSMIDTPGPLSHMIHCFIDWWIR